MSTSFSNVFGGQALYPDNPTYVSLNISANAALAWPIEQQISGNQVFAAIIDIVATVANLTVTLPDARTSGLGNAALINNKGAQTVAIANAGGGPVLSLAPGLQWFIYLTDNTTQAGVWASYQLGATISVANAAALAGAGLTAIGNTLNQSMPVSSTALSKTFAASDLATASIWIGGTGTFTLPDAGSVGNAWFTIVKNLGTGNVTLLAVNSQVIDDSPSIAIAPGQSCFVGCDGTQFFSVGLSSSAGVSGFDFTTLNVSGAGDFVLSGANLNRISYRAQGAMTGDRKIVVPGTVQEYWIDNETTGAFVLSIGTSTQAPGIIIAPGQRVITYCDGTNVISASSSAVVFPVTLAQGGTGATTPTGALANLGAVPNTRAILAGSGLLGGGDLTATRTLSVDGGAVALLANSNVFTGAQQSITAIAPLLTLVDTSGAADTQRWDQKASGGQLHFSAVNDLGTTSIDWLTVTRTGISINSIALSGNVNINAPASGAALTVQVLDASSGVVLNDQAAANGFNVLFSNIGVGRGVIGTGAATFTGAAIGDFGIAALTGTLRLGYGSGATTAMSISPTGSVSIASPSSNVQPTLNIQGTLNQYSAIIQNGNTVGQSFGLFIVGGTNNNDWPLIVENAAQTTIHFRVRGDGQIDIGNAPITSSASAGSASALPALPAQYVTLNIGGVNRKFPCYNL